MLQLVFLQLRAVDGLGPDASARSGDEIGRFAFELDPAVGEHGHQRAEVGDVVDDVGREDDDDIVADAGEQVEEAIALLGIEAGGRLIDDDQVGIADQRLSDSEALAHAAREAGDRLVAHRPEVRLFEQAFDHRPALAAAGDALEDRKLIKVIPVAETVQRISMSLDGRWVFTSDQKRPRLAIIDTTTNEVTNWIALPAVGYGTTPTPDGKWLLVSMQSANSVAVVDLAQMKVVRTVPVGANPVQILARHDRPVAYVSCSGDGKVAVLNLSEWKVEKQIATGPGADGLAWVERKP